MTEVEALQIERLSKLGLPPVTSIETLAAMIGVNPGLVWSFVERPSRYYQAFPIAKGRGVRTITAPRVALKVVQKWLSFHFARTLSTADHVYGFVPGRSHLDAANLHREAEWAFSTDIRDFFGSTPQQLVQRSLEALGYHPAGAALVTRLTCLGGFLPQGAPTSPVLSNACFAETDGELIKIAERYGCRVTRYADDITFSGAGGFPEGVRADLHSLMAKSVWELAPQKESLQPIKGRIKVHGLLVGSGKLRLTKGYRNKIRAYRHVIETQGLEGPDGAKLRGHVRYAEHVHTKTQELSTRPLPALNSISPSEVPNLPIVAHDTQEQARGGLDAALGALWGLFGKRD